MRVIAGSAKGTRLGRVPPGTRPVSDRAREGLFSSLGDVGRMRVLDLFAGSGSLGIEALSRGAEHAVFVDRSRRAMDAVRRNLDLTGLAGRATLRRREVLAFLLAEGPDPEEGFDLVLCDPPYAERGSDIEQILAATASAWLRAPGWKVALTRPSESSMPVIPLHWRARRRLDYGDSLLIVYQEDPWA